jgi:predicted ATPase
VRGQECELVTIRSPLEGRGVGRSLLDAVRDAAIAVGCTRLWLITANDNCTRILTLSGAGGCGKTRLALQVAAECLELHSGGTWFVDLAPVSDPNQVVAAMAASIGLREQPGRSLLQTALDYLESRQVLLVMDNCEHLVEACAGLAESLTRSAPLLTVLATSREPLRAAGEKVWRVPSLDESSAVELFKQRARQSATAFSVTPDNASTVTAICARLDHIPLAIELAAARVTLIPPDQILERLDRRFQLLTGGPRTALPRQQTLAATVEWSHALLSPEERTLFRRLSVFRDGFTLDAAEAVCSDEDSPKSLVLDLLGRLVDKSLIMAGDAGGTGGRYGMLETMRHFALERLVESGEADRLRERHARYFFELADRWPPVGSANEPPWLVQIEAEQDNLRQALSWLRSNDPGSCLRMAGGLLRFWDNGRYSEARTLLRELLAMPGGELSDRALGLINLGRLAAWSGDWGEAEVAYQEGLAACLDSGEQRALGWALTGLGNVALNKGDRTTARDFYQRILAGWGEPRRRVGALNMLGVVAWQEGDLQLARSLIAQGATAPKKRATSGIADTRCDS